MLQWNLLPSSVSLYHQEEIFFGIVSPLPPAWSFKCHFDAFVWGWDPDWLPALTPLPPPKDQVYVQAIGEASQHHPSISLYGCFMVLFSPVIYYC